MTEATDMEDFLNNAVDVAEHATDAAYRHLVTARNAYDAECAKARSVIAARNEWYGRNPQ